MNEPKLFHQICESQESVRLRIESIEYYLDLQYPQEACLSHVRKFLNDANFIGNGRHDFDRVIVLMHCKDAAVEAWMLALE